jgi:hypothetical protein
LFVGELSVDSSKSISTSLNICLVLGVQVDLDNSLSINLHSGSLSNNLGGVNDVIQNSVLNGSQCARSGTGSGGLLVTAVRFSQNSTLSNNQNMASRELLFQLTNKSLLNLIDVLQQFERNVQEDGLASLTAVNLLSCCDVNATKRNLELCGSHLKVEKLVGNRLLEFIGFLLVESQRRWKVRKQTYSCNHQTRKILHSQPRRHYSSIVVSLLLTPLAFLIFCTLILSVT